MVMRRRGSRKRFDDCRAWCVGSAQRRCQGSDSRRSRSQRCYPKNMSALDITLSTGGGFLLEQTGSARVFTPEMLSDEQRLMKETADNFVLREVVPRVDEIEDKKPGLMRELLQKTGSIGLLGHDVPEEFGGLGGDKMSSSLIFEAVSR